MDPYELVQQFLQACGDRDLDTALSLVADDVVYDNVPVGVVTGRQGIRQVLGSGLSAAADEVEWLVLRQVAQGGLVMSERLDRFRVGQLWAEVPVVGVFVLDDRITLWRDYFDLASYREQKRRLMPGG